MGRSSSSSPGSSRSDSARCCCCCGSGGGWSCFFRFGIAAAAMASPVAAGQSTGQPVHRAASAVPALPPGAILSRRPRGGACPRPVARPPPGEWQLPGAPGGGDTRPPSRDCHLVAPVTESARASHARLPLAAPCIPDPRTLTCGRLHPRRPAPRRSLLTSPRPRLPRAPGRRRGLPRGVSCGGGELGGGRAGAPGPCRGRSPSA